MADATDPIGKIIQTLEDSGCSPEFIAEFLKDFHQEKTANQRKLLLKHKEVLKKEVHGQQKRIDCLDYLIYKLKL
ncbi:hypothetical protein JZO70_08770 [Enterococcus sp. 669A]|uniref:Uncharacterized protein n=1 Tax=Candidatus Enterococcus moelleringii TaxID=2815325 RepID=A0ABS3L9G1_9ENTE|nr:hypothetical protein [Enterococcus sp. 669A]MBO1306250.1 hypothetical protein [Enterococcus sp. 669A]